MVRWVVATGLLCLALLDIAAALLLSPAGAAVFVLDPLRPDWVQWTRALFAVGPGFALAFSVAVTCVIGAVGVIARQSWAPALGLILAVLHAPYVVVSAPLVAAVRSLPEWGSPDPEST